MYTNIEHLIIQQSDNLVTVSKKQKKSYNCYLMMMSKFDPVE